MKTKNIIAIVTVSIIAGTSLPIWSAFAAELTPVDHPLGQGVFPRETDPQALAQALNRAALAIRTGAKVAPLLEVEGGDGHAVEEPDADGWIVDVTLDEVVAALAAAAKTPGSEDDIVAKRMAHRGSYRYFPEP